MRLRRGWRSLALRTLTALALGAALSHVPRDDSFVAKAYAGKSDKGGNNSGGGNNGGGGQGGGKDKGGSSSDSGPGGGAGGGSPGSGGNSHDTPGQGNPGGNPAPGSNPADVQDRVDTTTGDKVEVGRGTVEVTHSNGMKEKVENGRFRMEDKFGRTIVDRKATAADVDRLKNL